MFHMVSLHHLSGLSYLSLEATQCSNFMSPLMLEHAALPLLTPRYTTKPEHHHVWTPPSRLRSLSTTACIPFSLNRIVSLPGYSEFLQQWVIDFKTDTKCAKHKIPRWYCKKRNIFVIEISGRSSSRELLEDIDRRDKKRASALFTYAQVSNDDGS